MYQQQRLLKTYVKFGDHARYRKNYLKRIPHVLESVRNRNISEDPITSFLYIENIAQFGSSIFRNLD